MLPYQYIYIYIHIYIYQYIYIYIYCYQYLGVLFLNPLSAIGPNQSVYSTGFQFAQPGICTSALA